MIKSLSDSRVEKRFVLFVRHFAYQSSSEHSLMAASTVLRETPDAAGQSDGY
jgi:hypothetical protein